MSFQKKKIKIVNRENSILRDEDDILHQTSTQSADDNDFGPKGASRMPIDFSPLGASEMPTDVEFKKKMENIDRVYDNYFLSKKSFVNSRSVQRDRRQSPIYKNKDNDDQDVDINAKYHASYLKFYSEQEKHEITNNESEKIQKNIDEMLKKKKNKEKSLNKQSKSNFSQQTEMSKQLLNFFYKDQLEKINTLEAETEQVKMFLKDSDFDTSTYPDYMFQSSANTNTSINNNSNDKKNKDDSGQTKASNGEMIIDDLQNNTKTETLENHNNNTAHLQCAQGEVNKNRYQFTNKPDKNAKTDNEAFCMVMEEQLINCFYRDRTPSSLQIRSYNNFVTDKIPEIFKKFGHIKVKIPDIFNERYIRITFIGKCTFVRPKIIQDEHERILYPSTCRLLKKNYVSKIKKDVQIEIIECSYVDGEKQEKVISNVVERNVVLLYLPTMVGSILCNTNIDKNIFTNEKQGTIDRERLERHCKFLDQECCYDTGGYFISSGNEKAVISQIASSKNEIMIYSGKNSLSAAEYEDSFGNTSNVQLGSGKKKFRVNPFDLYAEINSIDSDKLECFMKKFTIKCIDLSKYIRDSRMKFFFKQKQADSKNKLLNQYPQLKKYGKEGHEPFLVCYFEIKKKQCAIPLPVLLKALGIRNDLEMSALICNDSTFLDCVYQSSNDINSSENSTIKTNNSYTTANCSKKSEKIMDYLNATLLFCQEMELTTQKKCIAYIANKIHVEEQKNCSFQELYDHTVTYLNDYFLPHIFARKDKVQLDRTSQSYQSLSDADKQKKEHDVEMKNEIVKHEKLFHKCMFVCNMAHKYINALIDKSNVTNRDSLKYKTVEMAGDLMAIIFSKTLQKLRNNFKQSIEKTWKKGFDVRRLLHSCVDKNKQSMQYCIATGNWCLNNKENQIARNEKKHLRVGVTQIMNTQNINARHACLNIINTALDENMKSAKPRQLQGTNWGMICPDKTPEGKKIGIVNEFAIFAQNSYARNAQQVTQKVIQIGQQYNKQLKIEKQRKSFSRHQTHAQNTSNNNNSTSSSGSSNSSSNSTSSSTSGNQNSKKHFKKAAQKRPFDADEKIRSVKKKIIIQNNRSQKNDSNSERNEIQTTQAVAPGEVEAGVQCKVQGQGLKSGGDDDAKSELFKDNERLKKRKLNQNEDDQDNDNDGTNSKTRVYPNKIYYDYDRENIVFTFFHLTKDMLYLIFNENELSRQLDSQEKMDKYERKRFAFISLYCSSVKIYVNSNLIGLTKNPRKFVELCRKSKKSPLKGELPYDCSISFDSLEKEIRIRCYGGRFCRPLLTVNENNRLNLSEEMLKNLYKSNALLEQKKEIESGKRCKLSEDLKNFKFINWSMLVEKGIIEYVDTFEEDSSLISMYSYQLSQKYDRDLRIKFKFSHCEVTACSILGHSASCIPYPQSNQAPRNVYQAAMGIQAQGVYSTRDKFRIDHSSQILWYGQKPLITTQVAKATHYHEMTTGINVICAIMCYTGYNQEDSIIFNQGAIDRGLFRAFSQLTMTDTIDTNKNNMRGMEEYHCNPYHANLRKGKYKKEDCVHLDQDGLPRVGERIVKGMVVIGKICVQVTVDPSSGTNCEVVSDLSVRWKKDIPQRVVDVIVTETNNRRVVHVKLISVRIPQIGDKFCLTPDHQVQTLEHGWIPIDQVTKKHKVACLNPQTHELSYETPTEIISFDHKGQMYHISNQQIDTTTTLNHKLYVKKRNRQNFELLEAESIIGKRVRFKKDAINTNQESIEFTIKGFGRKVPTENFLKFFGVWLAEGWCEKVDYRVVISACKPRVQSLLDEVCGRMGLHITKNKDKWIIYNKAIWNFLSPLSVGAVNKFIPRQMFSWLGPQNCQDLIEGMMCGDGHKTCYYTSSIKLRDDFQQLCLHAGWSATYVLSKPAGSTSTIIESGRTITSTCDHWKLGIVKTRNEPQINHGHVHQQNIQVEEIIEYDGKVFCLTIPNHVFYVRRNGKTMWTGNSSRHGQKGTIGMIYREEDMPYTVNGLRPDIIINPHAIPSRMTIGQLVEMVGGTVCATMGQEFLATPFVDYTNRRGGQPNAEVLCSLLKKHCGFSPSGKQVMYSGFTSKMLEKPIFIGTCFYQRLKHNVDDKIQARLRGPKEILTRQPTHGKAKDGGIRFGEMERDCVIAHGAASFLRDRTMVASDEYEVAIHNRCGMIALWNRRKQMFLCKQCNDRRTHNFKVAKMPYAMKLLIQELQSMSITTRLFNFQN